MFNQSIALLLTVSVLAGVANPQTPNAGAAAPRLSTTRIDLQRHDLGLDGREVIQARIDFGPGVFAPMHMHPGEEIIYVLEGSLEYEIKGQQATTLKAGGVLFVPAGTPHSARNVGNGKSSELATYILEKGKPLIEVAQ